MRSSEAQEVLGAIWYIWVVAYMGDSRSDHEPRFTESLVNALVDSTTTDLFGLSPFCFQPIESLDGGKGQWYLENGENVAQVTQKGSPVLGWGVTLVFRYFCEHEDFCLYFSCHATDAQLGLRNPGACKCKLVTPYLTCISQSVGKEIMLC